MDVPETPTKVGDPANSPIYTYLTVLVIVIAAAAAAIYSDYPNRVATVIEPSLGVSEEMLPVFYAQWARKQLDWNGAVRNATTVLEDTELTVAQRAALARIMSSAQTRIGTEVDRQAAYQNLHDIASDMELPAYQRARAITSLLEVYDYDPTPETFALIFSGPVLGEYATEADPEVALLRAAELAQSISPSIDGAVAEGRWYNTQLLRYSPTDDQRLEWRQKLSAILQSASDSIAQIEDDAEPGTYYWLTLRQLKLARYAGTMAIYDPAYVQDFESRFAEVFERIESRPGDLRTRQLLPNAQFNYAAYLHEIYGEARLADVKDRLAKLVDSLKDTSNPLISDFLHYIDSIIERGATSKSYRFVEKLVKISPEFKQFLITRNGDF